MFHLSNVYITQISFSSISKASGVRDVDLTSTWKLGAVKWCRPMIKKLPFSKDACVRILVIVRTKGRVLLIVESTLSEGESGL